MPEVNIKGEETKQYSEEVKTALKNLMDYCEKEDQYTRQRHIYEAKMADLYWHGFQYIYWDSQSQEFRIPTHDSLVSSGSARGDEEFIYDFITNIFKAHGLSIIAAMGGEVPGVLFSPENANIAADIKAAVKAEHLGKIIHKKNNSKLEYFHALFTLFTQHILASYNYYERDKEYGETEVPIFKKKEQKTSPDMWDCKECVFSNESQLEKCPDCGAEMQMIPGKTERILSKVGAKKVNKGFPKIGIYGVINVRVPSYASNQKACGYLIRYSDQPIPYLISLWGHLTSLDSDSSDSYEKSARAPSVSNNFYEDSSNHLATLKEGWFRPWQYNALEKNEVELLKYEFPEGAYVAFAAEQFAEARQELLDDHWTITKGDLSRTIHGDPLGKIAIPQQDTENELNNLLLECLEHSIPVNFAEEQVLGLSNIDKQEVKPGLIYPAKKPIGYGSLGDAFYSMKTSTLPKEGTDLQQMNTEKIQFLLGSFPSIYGGSAQGGSKTLGEYQESRSYALQRLSIPNYFVSYWWAQTTYKAVKMYVKEMLDDNESYTLSTKDRRFETVQIFKDDFEGKFEVLIPESAGELPVTFGQKRGILISALQLNSPEINAYLFAPERMRITTRYLGFDEFTSDDEVQVMKIMSDISILLQSAPAVEQGLNGEEILIPTVMPDSDIDDDEIQLKILRLFLAGPGQEYKDTNKDGFDNVLARARIHKKNIIMAEQAEMQVNQPNQLETKNNGTNR